MRNFILTLIIILAAIFLAFCVWARGLDDAGLTARDVISKNLTAAGGAETVSRVGSLSFSAGASKYAASADGRMKVRSVLEEPAVFEAVLVEGTSVRKNSLGRVSEVKGFERMRWIILGRLIGGLFTLKPFEESLVYEGTASFGPERHHVLSSRIDGVKVSFYVDSTDFLVKRLVLSGAGADGQNMEECHEVAYGPGGERPRLPSTMFVAQVGVGGTYAPAARPLSDIKLEENLPDGFFKEFGINAGRAAAAPGRLEGNILFGQFDEEDFFVRIMTNWTEDDIRASGFQNGDVLVLSSGGAEFETKLFILESQVNDPDVYAPGNSLFTHMPNRYPMFYAQFNSLYPEERFLALRARIKVLAPITARKKL